MRARAVQDMPMRRVAFRKQLGGGISASSWVVAFLALTVGPGGRYGDSARLVAVTKGVQAGVPGRTFQPGSRV